MNPQTAVSLLKCEHIVEFLLFSYKRLCTVPFGIRIIHLNFLIILSYNLTNLCNAMHSKMPDSLS